MSVENNQVSDALVEDTLKDTEMNNIIDEIETSTSEIGMAAERIIDKITKRSIQEMPGLSEEDRAFLIEQQIELCELLERAVTILFSTSSQFTAISNQYAGWIEAHNKLVSHLNETLLRPSFLAGVIDERVDHVLQTRENEMLAVNLKKELSLVEMGVDAGNNMEDGQYLIYNAYPTNPEDYTLDELDSASYNMVKFKPVSTDGEETTLETINRKDMPVLFTALALKFSDDYVRLSETGEIEQINITTKDNKPYTLIKQRAVYEVLSFSTTDTLEESDVRH